MTARLRLTVILASTLLSACAHYHARPLPQSANLSGKLPTPTINVNKLRIPGLESTAFDASDGLDMTETVILAVDHSPKLDAERKRRGIRQAQLMQAGLLPDPSLSAGVDHPTTGPDSRNGYNVGINQDIRAILTRPDRQQAARASARQVNLDVLWQEWQVAEKARQLYVKLHTENRLASIYRSARNLYSGRYDQDRKALQANRITLDVSAGDLVNLVNASTRLRKLEQQQNQTRHDLNELLGLRPGYPLKLDGIPNQPLPSQREVAAATADLPHRRPDLIALQAGYDSQEAAVRQAILEQFPSLNIGVTRARDTAGVNTIGLGVSIGLPFFNGNRGHIAVARATRAHLRAEYQARLDKATSESDRTWQQTRILQRQLREVRKRIPELRRVADRARQSLRSGNLAAGTYITLRTQLLDKRAEAVQLQSSLQQAGIALETLLGMPLTSTQAPHKAGDDS